MKKGVLRNFARFTGKHLCQSLFFNKVEGLFGISFQMTAFKVSIKLVLESISIKLVFKKLVLKKLVLSKVSII